MNEQKNIDSRTLWVTILISAGVALLVSAIVGLALQIPSFIARRPRPAPEIEGLTLNEADEAVARYHLLVLPVGEEPSDLDEGVIISQKPEPGELIRSGGVVRVVLSSGKPMVQVPQLAGLELVQATDLLESAGLFVEDVVSKHDTLAEDLAIGTEPVAGTTVEKGSKVKLFVSLGPDFVEVPKVTGRKLSTASKIIREKGFAVGDITYKVTGEYYQGTVMQQTPKAGDMAPGGSSIDLVVAGVLR
jgi:beta-lactam-binding protein with PASTA domain